MHQRKVVHAVAYVPGVAVEPYYARATPSGDVPAVQGHTVGRFEINVLVIESHVRGRGLNLAIRKVY